MTFCGNNCGLCWHWDIRGLWEHGCAGHRLQWQEGGTRAQLPPSDKFSPALASASGSVPLGLPPQMTQANLHPRLRNHWDAYTLAFMEFSRESVMWCTDFDVSLLIFGVRFSSPSRMLKVLVVWFSLVGNTLWCVKPPRFVYPLISSGHAGWF